jgi:hypothetical protein
MFGERRRFAARIGYEPVAAVSVRPRFTGGECGNREMVKSVVFDPIGIPAVRMGCLVDSTRGEEERHISIFIVTTEGARP